MNKKFPKGYKDYEHWRAAVLKYCGIDIEETTVVVVNSELNDGTSISKSST
jgi:hypothetical protein